MELFYEKFVQGEPGSASEGGIRCVNQVYEFIERQSNVDEYQVWLLETLLVGVKNKVAMRKKAIDAVVAASRKSEIANGQKGN